MVLAKFLDILFPPACLNCRTGILAGTVLCEKCIKIVRLNKNLFCGRCSARIPRLRAYSAEATSAAKAGQGSGGQVGGQAGFAAIKKICHKDFPYTLGAATQYDSATVKNLIHALKFRCIKRAAEPLAALLIEYAAGLALQLENHSVIPIPLSRARLRRRGFNQAELIARAFAGYFSLPLETESLVRIKNTKPQSETKRLIERRGNISGCFMARDPNALRGKNIILIDDVTTSGATLFEAASVLKAAGARKILALTVARA
ncbi:MAG: double zinc ribbon domain-containing protein [Candidatus Liptonbacteria bacterium]|nr:double zinc ribbon domain-containing protein [Candidatus Liptonbacteria bacterium]